MMQSTIIDKIREIGYNASDPRMDGFYQFGQKQKLYEIYWAAKKQLKACPTFSTEQEWLDEHSQDELLEILKGVR